jgi:hypothetical protein
MLHRDSLQHSDDACTERGGGSASAPGVTCSDGQTDKGCVYVVKQVSASTDSGCMGRARRDCH